MSTKKGKEYDFFKLFDRFTSSIRRGKHLQKNGKRIKKSSLGNYYHLKTLLLKFCTEREFHLRIVSTQRMNKRHFKAEKKYWKNFYYEFTGFMYDDVKLVDNYAGSMIKLLRSFFNYLNQEMGMNAGTFHKNFHAHHEDIQIVVLSPERLNFLIYDKEFESSLPKRLKEIKDIFVFGCRVALRVSDLMRLNPSNLEKINDQVYLSILSQKTQTFTRVRLPDYAVEIINRRMTKRSLLPYYHNVYLNLYFKELMEKAGWTEPFPKMRQRRGVPVTVYKDPETKTHYRFCDMVTSHTMRRTAITTMLSMGMNEQLVRKVSGHAPNSKEFYRYVNYAQAYLDKELDEADKRVAEKRLVA